MAKKIKIINEVEEGKIKIKKEENKIKKEPTQLILISLFIFVLLVVGFQSWFTDNQSNLNNNINTNTQKTNYQPINNVNTQTKVEEKTIIPQVEKKVIKNNKVTELSKELTKIKNLLLCYQKAKKCTNKPIYNKDLPQEAINIAKKEVEYSYKDMCNFLKDYKNELINYTKTMCT